MRQAGLGSTTYEYHVLVSHFFKRIVNTHPKYVGTTSKIQHNSSRAARKKNQKFVLKTLCLPCRWPITVASTAWFEPDVF